MPRPALTLSANLRPRAAQFIRRRFAGLAAALALAALATTTMSGQYAMTASRDRYSIAFFYSPNIDARIEVLPSCTSPTNPPRYPPAIYRDLVKAFYSANYFHQQDHAKTPAAL